MDIHSNRTRDRNSNFNQKNENSARRRETMWARPRPPQAESREASKIRHDEQMAHQMVDIISSYCRSFTAQTLV